MADFGVIITCTKDDFIFAKGCCASVKYFMPDVPICILMDGDFSLEGLDTTYDTIVLTKSDIKNDFLRERSFGWGLTKMISFWEGPFEHFLWLDSDTNVWGDIRKQLMYQEYDFIIDIPSYNYSTESINKWFFDIEKMKMHFPSFKCENNPYVCTGVICSRKGILDIKEYQNILDFIHIYPDVFFPGEMGFLNYFIFNALQEARINLDRKDIQYIACDFDLDEFKKRFYFKNEKPYVNGLPTVIHWPGNAKPISANSFNHFGYEEPMRYFRKKFLEDSTKITQKQILKTLYEEDLVWVNSRMKTKNQTRFKYLYKAIINKISSLV